MSLTTVDETLVHETLYQVIDPELGINIVDLGLVYCVEACETGIGVFMTLTTPGCPMHNVLTSAVERTVRLSFPMVECVTVNLVWNPPWDPTMISEAGLRDLGWR